MFSIALAMFVAATPVKVASTDWVFSGLDPALAGALESRFVTLLARGGIHVTTAKDVKAMLGLERQKQLLGCAESACTAELAGALGVDGVLFGSVVKAGAGYTVTLRVASASSAQPMSSLSERVAGVEGLQDWLDEAAKKMADELQGKSGPPQEAVVATVAPRSKVVPWVPAILGGAVAIGGAVVFSLRSGPANELQTRVFPDAATVSATRKSGEAFETAGLAMIGVGVAAIVASAIWFAVSPSDSVKVAFAPAPGGAVLAVGGRFP